MANSSPKNRALFAVIWSAVDVFFRQGLQFLIAVLLARLLSPEDFGLIAILYIFTAIAGLFIDSGFSSALIQHQDINPSDESTVFYFNLGMAALMSLVLCAAAPLIADFFARPILRDLVFILAVSQFIGAFGAIHTALLTKKLLFKTIMQAGVVSSTLSGGLALFLAYQGYGVWSLAWQALAASMTNIMALWFLHRWTPQLVFSRASLKKLFNFGGFLFISGLLDVLYTRMHIVLIGKLFSVSDLGIYNRALNTRQMPINILESVFNRVAFPVFSSAATDKAVLVNGIKTALIVMMSINIPVMLGLALTANSFTLVMFGEKWLPAAPILQILCFAGLLWPLHTVNLNALMAQGHSKLFFRIEVIKKFIGISATVAACYYDVIAFAWIQIFTGLIAFIINAHYTGALLGYHALRQIRDILPFLCIGIAATFLAALSRQFLLLSPLFELLLQTGIGGLFYILFCLIFIKKNHLGKTFGQILAR